MADDREAIELAPLDALIDILPKIELAKQRARLGNALEKATATVQRLARYPEVLTDLGTLASASGSGLESSRSDIEQTLAVIIKMAKVLASQPTIEDLDNVNQVGLTQLPLQMEKIEERIETAWRKTVREAFGGQAALGEVLTNIPGLEALGRELTGLAAWADKLDDKTKPAAWRVAERDSLVAQASALNDRLLGAGIAPPIAAFLVAVAAGPVRLSDLTDDIYAWIRDHDALALFTVSARRT
jgi:hypothetical protein